MYFCYLDESGTPELQAQTSHFVLLGLAIPASAWHEKDQRLAAIKGKYGLADAEIHTGYIARRFPEQEHITGFETLDSIQRRLAVEVERKNALIKAVALKSPQRLKSLKKLYAKTKDYVHLTFKQRQQLIFDRFDKAKGKVVGIRHYVGAKSCGCKVCLAHRGHNGKSDRL